jgi:mono/diheme cytochrome c family protein
MKREEDYTPHLGAGLALTLAAIFLVSLYWLAPDFNAAPFKLAFLGEKGRLEQAAEEFEHERVSRGQKIYQAQCSSCHGPEGEGGIGPALNNKNVLKNTQDEIFFSVIRSGVPSTQMPAWSVDYGGPLTDEDVRDAVAFIRAWEPTAPEIVPVVIEPSAERGALLFASTCAVCHGENGAGTDRAPAINDSQRLAGLDNDWYRSVIKNGRPAKGMPTWGTVLNPGQVDDLVALIESWRAGQAVTAAFDITELLNAAIYSLENQDAGSALLQVTRAMLVAPPVAAEILDSADVQLKAGDNTGALATLKLLQDQWPVGDTVNGQAVYAKRCAPCHGAEGQGGVGMMLKPNEFIQGLKNAGIIDFLKVGRTGTAMAGFKGRLTDAELADIVTFLRSWQP